MTYLHLLVPAATIFLTTLLILSAGSQVLDNVMDEEAGRTSHGVERVTFRRTRRQTDAVAYQNGTRVCTYGHFEDHSAATHKDDFDCNKCTDCTALKKQTQQECRRQHDAVCGPCLSGFCPSGDICQPCPTVGYKSTTTVQLNRTTSPSLSYRIHKEEHCNTVCQTGINSPFAPGDRRSAGCVMVLLVCVSALGACGCLVFFGGALILYYMKKKKKQQQLLPARENSFALPKFVTNIPSSGNLVTLFPEAAILLEKDCHSLLQGKTLYTIINAVPVRRWKEFVRGLGLRDSEIELVELDYPQFREQQYEMLKCWCQRQGASLDAVFATLEEMELGGCVQQLRVQLQHHHLQQGP